jgi:hypothetical protein
MENIKGFADMSDSDRKKALNKMKKREAKKRNKHQQIIPVPQNNTSRSGHTATGNKPRAANDDARVNGCSTDEPISEGAAAHNSDVVAQSSKSSAEKLKPNPGWMETDADGLEHVKKLLNVAEAELTPLGEATKRIRLLEQFSSQNVMTFVLGFETAMRKRKVLQALRAVRRALALDAEHPGSIFIAVRLRHALEFGELQGAKNAATTAVLDSKGHITSAKGVVEFVEDYAARNLKHIFRRLGAGEIMLWLAQADCPGARSSLDAVDFIIAALQDASPHGRSDMSISVSFCADFLQRLSSGAFRLGQTIIDKIAQQLREKYPRCALFEQGAYGCMRVT